MKGVLSKKQRERKKMREIAHFVFQNKNEDWTRFVKEANKGNKFAEIKQDREEADKIIEKWRMQQNFPMTSLPSIQKDEEGE